MRLLTIVIVAAAGLLTMPAQATLRPATAAAGVAVRYAATLQCKETSPSGATTSVTGHLGIDLLVTASATTVEQAYFCPNCALASPDDSLINPNATGLERPWKCALKKGSKKTTIKCDDQRMFGGAGTETLRGSISIKHGRAPGAHLPIELLLETTSEYAVAGSGDSDGTTTTKCTWNGTADRPQSQ